MPEQTLAEKYATLDSKSLAKFEREWLEIREGGRVLLERAETQVARAQINLDAIYEVKKKKWIHIL